MLSINRQVDKKTSSQLMKCRLERSSKINEKLKIHLQLLDEYHFAYDVCRFDTLGDNVFTSGYKSILNKYLKLEYMC